MDFDFVISPLTRKTFLRDYWNTSFLRMPGAAGRFTELLTWEDLNAILEQHRLAPPRLKLSLHGHSVEPERYMSPGMGGVPRLDSGKLAACLGEGATLVLDFVQELSQPVRALAQAFQQTMHADNFVNLYASWRSENGFRLHWDSQDTVILQLSGRKHWKVYRPTRLHPLQDDVEVAAIPTGEPVWDGMLEDGDALYIPRGWWHVAHSVNEPSLHLNISMVPPHGMNFLRWAVEKMRCHAEARANLPALDDTAAQLEQLKTLKALLNDIIGDTAIADFRREWEGGMLPAPHIRLPQAPYEQFAALTDQTRVRLAAAQYLSFVRNGPNFEFRANGVAWGMPADLLPALEMLTNSRDVSIAELSARLSNQAAIANLMKSIGVLARAGVVLIEKPATT